MKTFEFVVAGSILNRDPFNKKDKICFSADELSKSPCTLTATILTLSTDILAEYECLFLTKF